MGGDGDAAFFSKIVSEDKIITLASYDDFYGYYPYHQSKRNGLLGSHLDLSNFDKNI